MTRVTEAVSHSLYLNNTVRPHDVTWVREAVSHSLYLNNTVRPHDVTWVREAVSHSLYLNNTVRPHDVTWVRQAVSHCTSIIQWDLDTIEPKIEDSRHYFVSNYIGHLKWQKSHPNFRIIKIVIPVKKEVLNLFPALFVKNQDQNLMGIRFT